MAQRSLVIAAAAALLLAAGPAAEAAPFRAGQVIVHYQRGTSAVQAARAQRAADALAARRLPDGSRQLRLARGAAVATALARLRANPHVRYAVPNYVAHASDLYPNDTGFDGPGGWAQMQWNFTGAYSVNAPRAWSEAIAARAPGGRGVTVAVLDTGVAYENYRRFRRDPDLYAHRFVRGYDFVSHDRHPDDEEGHGTHVTGTIAQRINNSLGATGLAYGVRIMPVRVLDAHGEGDAGTIARAIRWAATHRARVINLSLEFDSSITGRQIPDILSAVRFAHRKGVVVVGAAGNEADSAVAYPARASHVISVGGTTEHGCQAEYSNTGTTLDVVAPGGGADAANSDNPYDQEHCRPGDLPGRDIFQYTFTHSVRSFGLPAGYEGTSMACPHVSAIAALIIATKVIGTHPTPRAVARRIEATARDLGAPGRDRRYGYGLVDAAAAIDPSIRTP